MTDWTDADSSANRTIASVAVPRRAEMMATMASLVPFGTTETFRIVELGSGDGRLAATLLDCFAQATLVALDGSDSMRAETARRTQRFADRIAIRSFDLASPAWWDVMRDADVVLSSLCVHHLNNAKKQYLYKAAAERLSSRGALLVADVIDPQHPVVRHVYAESGDAAATRQAKERQSPEAFEAFRTHQSNHFRFPDSGGHPSPVFFQLVWLKHAGFAVADCFWAFAGQAIIGAFKSPGMLETPLLPYELAVESARRALEG